jgi:hypothetical protein
MNSFVMSHEAWLLLWSRSACPVCLPTGVCGVGRPAFNIGADNDQRNHFAASLLRQQWPCAMSVDILADHMKAHVSLRGRLPARCQMTRAMASARTSGAPISLAIQGYEHDQWIVRCQLGKAASHKAANKRHKLQPVTMFQLQDQGSGRIVIAKC